MLTERPRKGERIRFDGNPALHTVVRTPEGDDNLCWIHEDGKRDATVFIWRFSDTLNVLATVVQEGAP